MLDIDHINIGSRYCSLTSCFISGEDADVTPDR